MVNAHRHGSYWTNECFRTSMQDDINFGESIITIYLSHNVFISRKNPI